MRKELNNDIYKRELSALIKSSALINSSLQTADVLNFAMKAAEEFMDAEASSVYELDIEKKDIIVRLARGEKGGFIQSKRLKIGEGIAGWVIQNGKPIDGRSMCARNLYLAIGLTGKRAFTTHSLICIPITIRGKANRRHPGH